MTTHEVQIDPDKILEIALRSVRRAYMFMGFGVNAATDPAFKAYGLEKHVHFHAVPKDLSDEQIEASKADFRLWIEANGFRELTETFAVFLDGINLCSILVSHIGIAEKDVDIGAAQKKFAKLGLKDKLEHLDQSYGVLALNREYLLTLNAARNCLVHRRGLVGAEDTGDGQLMIARWLAADIAVIEPDGTTYPIDVPAQPIRAPEGSTITLVFVERERQFKFGEYLHFSTADLAEVCWFFLREASSVRDSFVQFASSRGVPFVAKVDFPSNVS